MKRQKSSQKTSDVDNYYDGNLQGGPKQ